MKMRTVNFEMNAKIYTKSNTKKEKMKQKTREKGVKRMNGKDKKDTLSEKSRILLVG